MFSYGELNVQPLAARCRTGRGYVTDAIRDQAQALTPELLRWRRHLHQHPELGFAEVATQRYLMQELAAMGLEPRPIARTGVVVDIGEAPYVMVRADMDGLPIEEGEDVPFHSRNAGVMHACGHDGHMAIALGTAAILSRRRASRDGGPAVRVIFQPSEERHPGGAPTMIAEGVLDGVSHVTGCHLRATVPTGRVGAVVGAQTANSDRFVATVVGRGGHGSAPQFAIDPIPVVCEAVLAVQTMVSRRVPPQRAAVVTVGAIHAGTAANIIPDRATFQGTVRTFDDDVRDLVEGGLPGIIQGVAAAHGARAEVQYARGYPSVVNTAPEVAAFERAARRVLGPDAVHPLSPGMGGEDFAFYLRERPGVFWILGAQIPGRPGRAHNPSFAFNEDALALGVAVMAETARELAAGRAGRGRTA
jgi:amidohydrolase